VNRGKFRRLAVIGIRFVFLWTSSGGRTGYNDQKLDKHAPGVY